MAGTTKRLDLLGAEVEDCVFCRIARGKLPSHVVFEDDVSIAFLDNNPVFPGHCLLIPKVHHQLIAQLPNQILLPLFANLQIVSEGVKAGMKADGTFMAINNGVSQHVPHLHIHIIPRCHGDGLRGFFWPRTRYETEGAATAIQKAITAAIDKLRTE